VKTRVFFKSLTPVLAVFFIAACNPFYPAFDPIIQPEYPVINRDPLSDYYGRWLCDDEKYMEILTIAKNSVIQETGTGSTVEFIIDDSWVKVNFYSEGYRGDFDDYNPDGFRLDAYSMDTYCYIVIFLKNDNSSAIIYVYDPYGSQNSFKEYLKISD